jgi:hypothetical protein
MKIVVYGDSYVYGSGLDLEYAVNKKYIDDYFQKEKLKEKEEAKDFLLNNRWTFLLEKALDIKIENYGLPGVGWQYIEYIFLKNEMLDYEEKIYIICPPRLYPRYIIDNKYRNDKLKIVSYENYNVLNAYYNKEEEKTEEIDFLNNIKTEKVQHQLNFQNVFGILNYLLLNKKKFLFLPSWLSSLSESMIITNFNDDYFKDKNILNFFFKRKVKSDNDKIIEINKFYHNFIFKHIDDIKFNLFWRNENYVLPSGHPNMKGHLLIKNEYFKHFRNIL